MIQTAWIAVALWIGHRRAQLAGVLVVAVVIAVLLRGYGLVVLIQPWNPYLPLIAWIVVLLATWSVVCGDHMMLVPLVVAASFAAQTHIPYLLMAGGLGVFAVAVVLVRCWRSDDRRAFVRPLAWTGGLFAVLWLRAVGRADPSRSGQPPPADRPLHVADRGRDRLAHGRQRPAAPPRFRRRLPPAAHRHRSLPPGRPRTRRSHLAGGAAAPRLDRLGRRRRSDAASLADRARHGDRGDAAAVVGVDGPHLRHRLVLPDALGLGHDDPPDRRHRVDGGSVDSDLARYGGSAHRRVAGARRVG